MPTAEQPVALVTGAGSGIGRAIALMLARRGYRLVLVGRRPGPLEQTGALLGTERAAAWEARPADIGAERGCAAAIDGTIEAFGRLDALISNAGLAELRTIREHSSDDIRRVFEVNALGPTRLVARAWPHFERQQRGCVVLVSSLSAFDPFPGLGVYGAAKAALNTLARACVNEGGASGVRAFAVAPGAVETPMLRAVVSAADLPTEKCLTPEQVARIVVECVTGERDAENGRTILVPSPA